MKLLLLGGTRFLGRAVVDAALARGHQVTLFTRGVQPNAWGAAVTMLAGNRDPAVAPGLTALDAGSWDAVIDTSGYVPRVVGASANKLRDRVGRYLFVSSISVYADMGMPGVDENAPVGTLDDPATEEVAKFYGPLKAACEDVVRKAYGSRATIVRPGLIVGAHDPTDRFGYWVARFVRPQLLGARGESAVLPAPRERPLQVIDACDLGAWMLHAVENGIDGTFNATSPAGRWTFADLVGVLVRQGGATAPRPVWIDEAQLLEHKVEPWTGLPMWLPGTFAESGGMMQVDCRRAEGAGLHVRAIEDTVAATAAWLEQRDNASAWKIVLSADAERELAAAVALQ
ncbi:MAG: epimerase [Betaproteobacteria bacterium]